MHRREIMTDIAFEARSLLAIQERLINQQFLAITVKLQNFFFDAGKIDLHGTLSKTNHRRHRRVTPVATQSIAD